MCWEQLKMKGKETPKESFEKFTGHMFLKKLKGDINILDGYATEQKDRNYLFWQRDPLAILITDNKNANLDIKYKIEYSRLPDSIERLLQLAIQNSKSEYITDAYVENGEDFVPMSFYLDDAVSKSNEEETSDELKGAIRFVASLSCIDGLVVLNKNLGVEGFGAVIKTKEVPSIIYTSKTSLINENSLTKVDPNNFGTRHRSMFAFCWANEYSVGFVISQDGDIRAITRVNDKLIMWENIRVLKFIQSHKLKRPIKS
jgi:hypothetical protein